MFESLDLITYVYQYLVPKIEQGHPPKKSKIYTLIEENSLEAILAMEKSLGDIAKEFIGNQNDVVNLYRARAFLAICECDNIKPGQAEKCIEYLVSLKLEERKLNTSAVIEDFISNLNPTIAEASLSSLFEWANIIKNIPATLGKHDSFIPMLSSRLQILIWNKMPTESMNGNIELAETLLKCTAYKDIELTDLIDMVMDHCINFLETTNEVHQLDKAQGSTLQLDLQNITKLLGILKSFEVANKDITSRLSSLVKMFGVNEHKVQNEEIRMNEIRKMNEFTLTEKIFYNHNDSVARTSTCVIGGFASSGIPIAVKIYTVPDRCMLTYYETEVNALKTLSNKKKCFLQYYGVVVNENSLYIITECCERTLYDDMTTRKRDNRPYSGEERLNIIKELLDGFGYMSSKKMYHQDIKPQNIMFTGQGELKIIDFNSVVIDSGDNSEINAKMASKGNKSWMSPEYLKALMINSNQKPVIKHKKSDVFCLGLVFLKLFTFEDLTGKNQENSNEELLKIVDTKIDHEPCKEVILKMLNLDPEKRPSFKKVAIELAARLMNEMSP
ncbi:hypothetical protein SteCoe_22715 [Stentor coeruleus]|uniref:Protein kinase domain-containing protein n=1 Tax=Stentor coeruleus TaxID=5963 RepID=A0A1R2BLK0_9CILI|nr:hypothetical protein SteCoe_22715 [Stentor coeruleus]